MFEIKNIIWKKFLYLFSKNKKIIFYKFKIESI